jgi:hypothetical protein
VTSAAISCWEKPQDPPADAVAEGPITFKLSARTYVREALRDSRKRAQWFV